MRFKTFICLIVCIALCMTVLNGCASKKKDNSDTKEENSMVKCAEFDGKQMEYIRFGKEGSEILVILPGLSLKSVMGSAEAIVSAYSLLAENYDIYLFDHIKEEPKGYTVEDMADDTLKAFDLLNIEHCHLMGVSMGGMVAQTIALKDPERVASLILCSTASDVKDLDQTGLKTWRDLAEKRDLNGLMKSFGENVYTPSFFETYRDIILSSGEGASELNYENFIVSIDAIKDFSVKEELDRISCPVFVLGAGEDRVVGVQSSYDIVNALNCEYYIYEGYGHGVYDEAPDYLSRIDGFLKGIKQ